MRFITYLIFIFLSADLCAQNQIRNPGFEKEEGWNFWGGVRETGARSERYCLKVHNDQPAWSGADQIIKFPAETQKVEIRGWMKTENVVKGSNSWEMARIAVEFLDNSGELAGGYPPVAGQASGTSDWRQSQASYLVPAGASRVKVQVALGNATGTAWYDDFELIFLDSSGNFLDAVQISGPADEGEWYEAEVHPGISAGHYVDWSCLLDAPAGKHGFVTASGDSLIFEDGTPARFWGTNLVASACFPDKKTSDSLALRLARMGCNLVRFHHMDAPWSTPNIFGNTTGSRKLSEESLKSLDYLIYSLEKRGIYIFMDLLVHRDFSEEDGVRHPLPDLGGKQVGYFDEKIIELQKEYADQLLSHVNPYTGKAYREDPAIVCSEFINESSAFLHFGGDILNGYYREQLDSVFASEFPGKKRAVFDLDYSSGIAPRVMLRSGSDGDIKETIGFLSGLENRYYRSMYDHLRNKGVKYPLAGSNLPLPVLAYQHNNSFMDIVISNEYWDHPQLWKTGNDWSRVLYAPMDNKSMIRNPARAIPAAIGRFVWDKKPFIVTEYNFCSPNEYRLEGPPMVAAYACLQGHDGMLQFDFGQGTPGSERPGNFALAKDLDQLAQWVVAAPMFLRRDVSQAKSLTFDRIEETELVSLPLYSEFLEKNFHLPYITRTAKTTDPGKEEPEAFDRYFDRENKTIISETGELKLDYGAGIFIINTANIQGAEGALNTGRIDLPVFSIELRNSWASVMAVSKDGKPLEETDCFYLVVATPVKVSGQLMNESRTALVEIGDLPVLAQKAEGMLEFKIKAKQIKIYPINVIGEREAPVTIKSAKNFHFDFSEEKTFVYEVRVKR